LGGQIDDAVAKAGKGVWRMDVLVDEVARAICGLIRAQAGYNEANLEYDGRSWIWAGAEVIKELDSAKNQLKSALDAYIDDRIARAKGQRPVQ